MYVYYKRDAGRYFTKAEFIRYVKKKTLRTIQKYDMLRYDDVIAVAVSGGKDSVALLYIIDEIEREFPTEIVIVHVDEGIVNYSDRSEPIILKHAKTLGHKVYQASFRDLFNFTIDDVARYYLKGRINLEPCSICGEWRRWALNKLARDAGATVLATAHTLDDFTQTVLMDVMRNSLDRLLRLVIRREKVLEGFVPRIYPFVELYEKETALYTHLLELDHNDVPCPYAQLSMRWDIRLFLYQQEEKHPGTLHNILRFHQNLLKSISEQKLELRKCEICGYPTTDNICRAHKLEGMLKSLS